MLLLWQKSKPRHAHEQNPALRRFANQLGLEHVLEPLEPVAAP